MNRKSMATVSPPPVEVITTKCRLCDGLLVRDMNRKCLYCPNPRCYGLGEKREKKDVKPNRYIDVKPTLEQVVEVFEQMYENRKLKFKCPICGMGLVPEQKSSRLYCSYCAARAETQIKAIFVKEFAAYEERIREIVEEVITHKKG